MGNRLPGGALPHRSVSWRSKRPEGSRRASVLRRTRPDEVFGADAGPETGLVRDPLRLWVYHGVALLSTLICLREGLSLLGDATLKGNADGPLVALAGAVLLLPLLVTGLFGLRADCAPAGGLVHVWTGAAGRRINLILIGAWLAAAVAILLVRLLPLTGAAGG
ncbi:MAG: hypothetical protein OEW11_00115 [Nitrospirota bacterium]|nr:hypothetical protein [Nitrospirota bacterium]